MAPPRVRANFWILSPNRIITWQERRLQNTTESQAITNPKTSCNVMCSIQEPSVMGKQIEPTSRWWPKKNLQRKERRQGPQRHEIPSAPSKSALDLVRQYWSSSYLFSNATISYNRVWLKERVYLTLGPSNFLLQKEHIVSCWITEHSSLLGW